MLRSSLASPAVRFFASSLRSRFPGEGASVHAVATTQRLVGISRPAAAGTCDSAPVRSVRSSRVRPAVVFQCRGFAQDSGWGSADHETKASSSSASADSPEKASAENGEEAPETSKKNADGQAEAEAEAKQAEAPAELSEAETLQKELDALQDKVKSSKHELLLALADFENNKKKFTKERQTRHRNAMVSFARRVIDVYGEFEHEFDDQVASELSESGKNLFEGIVLTRDVFKAGLERHGLEQFSPALGSDFLEKEHESEGYVASDQAAKTVAEVITPGWKFTDGSVVVLRQAKVKLADAAE